MVLGTVGYMSPEQVRGEPVDARTDIFSFGAVLYEMLSGSRAFARNSASDTLAAILRDDPPEPESTGRPIAPGLQRIVHHCLEKNPSQRFRSAHDVAFALENLSTGSDSAASVPRPAARRSVEIPWKWVALVAFAAAAAGLAGWVLRGAPPPAPTFQRLTFQQGTVENARFGADGKTVL
jgi:serine/threonine protein kinase